MEKTEDIRLLIDRFFEAETSLADEQRLYRYFSGETIDPALEEFREVFLGLDAWSLAPEEQLPSPQPHASPQPQPGPQPMWHRWLHYAAVASVALVLGLALWNRQDSLGRCIAYYDGRSTTDEDVVMGEMTSVMRGLMDYEPQQDVDRQLSDIFGR